MGLSFKLGPMVGARPVEERYDVVIAGGGPAGITAAIYSARYGLKTLLATKYLGGNMGIAPLVDDYPGIPEVKGTDLVNMFVKHLNKYNVPVLLDEVVDIKRKGAGSPELAVKLKSGKEIASYVVILAVGSDKKKLGVPGEEELVGRGVSYCATCDGPFFKGKVVAVVGGGNAALVSALYLAKLASKVYLIHRRNEFRAFKVYLDAARSTPNMELLTNSVITRIVGEDKVKGIVALNKDTNEEKFLEVDGVFIEIGLEPPVELFRRIGLELDETGRVKVNVDRSTSISGIFAAGDAAGGPYKYRFEQIITAAADGAIAADAAFRYILTIKSPGPQ